MNAILFCPIIERYIKEKENEIFAKSEKGDKEAMAENFIEGKEVLLMVY